jgi:hypothetical protein
MGQTLAIMKLAKHPRDITRFCEEETSKPETETG